MPPLPTGVVIAPTTHMTGFTFGDFLAGLITMAIESAMVPLPSELILPFAGFLVASLAAAILERLATLRRSRNGYA